VLIGHSLGGMTIMALAEERPRLFADRICGVAFLNTSAGDISRSGLLKLVLSRRSPVVPLVTRLSRWQRSACAVERVRYIFRNLIWSLTGRLSFGDKTINPELVELMNTMISSIPLEIMSNFLVTQGAHNRYATLEAMKFAKVLIIGADHDRLLPYKHSEGIAALLPEAALVRVKGAGHVAMLEQPKQVNQYLQELLSQCARNLPRMEKVHEPGARAAEPDEQRDS
jgi:pimeloyl-ACP methyl ester carboxylesterase